MSENIETNFIININEELVINPSIYKNMSENIDKPENKVLKFTLQNVDVSIANSIRRIILSEIPVVILDSLDKENIEDENIKIYENNSILNNEIIKQRLSCIPVCINDIENFEYKNYVVECNVKNNTNEKMIVTSGDLKIKNTISDEYLPTEEVNNIFRKNVVTNEFIDLLYLQPSFNEQNYEKIHFECGFNISDAKKNGSYNVASTCVYSFTKNEKEIQKKWKSMEEKLPQNKEARELAYNDFMNLDAERITIPNSYDFKVQSIGIYKNNELVVLACEIMIQKFLNFIKLLESSDDYIKPNLELMENAYNVKLENEDYTFGKVLENMMYLMFFLREKKLNYVSLKKNHPHDNYSLLMIAYKNKEIKMEEIVSDLKNISELNIEVYQNIKSNMTKV